MLYGYCLSNHHTAFPLCVINRMLQDFCSPSSDAIFITKQGHRVWHWRDLYERGGCYAVAGSDSKMINEHFYSRL